MLVLPIQDFEKRATEIPTDGNQIYVNEDKSINSPSLEEIFKPNR